MWQYWFMFFIAGWGALTTRQLKERQGRVAWVIVALVFATMMGFRHEVGGDWFNYLPHFEHTAVLTFFEAVGRDDPGYYGLNWVIAHLNGSVYWVNFVCASVLMAGTVVFCRRQPNPWLALLAGVPYMLIVVGMGYTRQSVALGFALFGLSALGDGRIRAFIVWVALGALFHKSAVLLLPIAALAASHNRFLMGGIVAASTGLLYYLLLKDTSEAIWANYVGNEMHSDGGAIRVAMNAVPAAMLVIFRRRLVPEAQELKLWLWISVFALACIPLVITASTAVDRVALYFIPIQMFVFARLPRLMTSVQSRTPAVLAIIAYYAAVQFVWLNYSSYGVHWLPYEFKPFS